MDAYSSYGQMMNDLLRSRNLLMYEHTITAATEIEKALSLHRPAYDELCSLSSAAKDPEASRMMTAALARNSLATAESMRLVDEAISLQLNRPNPPYPRFQEFAALQSLVARHRVPDLAEIVRAQSQSAESFNVGRIAALFRPDELTQMFSSIKAPWVDSANALASFESVAKFAEMGRALEACPFELSTRNLIAANLGDWSEARIPWDGLSHWNLRDTFYLDHGFDAKLVVLPEPAFRNSLCKTGILSHRLAGVVREEQSGAQEEEHSPERRSQAAFEILAIVESAVRGFIDERLSSVSPNWEKHRVSGEVRIQWEEKRKTAVSKGRAPQKLISYADFSDYRAIIVQKNNWTEVFSRHFANKRDTEVSFERLELIRIETMHVRPLTKMDFATLSVEANRVLRAIGHMEEM